MPSVYRAPGSVPGDIVIFVTARKITTDGVLAFALECESDSITNRPVAGFINFDPSNLSPDKSEVFDQQLKTALHEISHVLGFAQDKFANARISVTISGKKFINSTGVVNVVSSTFVNLGYEIPLGA